MTKPVYKNDRKSLGPTTQTEKAFSGAPPKQMPQASSLGSILSLVLVLESPVPQLPPEILNQNVNHPQNPTPHSSVIKT